MKLGFAALLLAISSSVAQPIAAPNEHLELRAAAKINISKLNQAISVDNKALAYQRNSITQLNRALSQMGSMSGKSITAARNAHRNAISAQKKAMQATQAAIKQLKVIRSYYS
ncbi:hypothetical protein BX667DRAFT_500555 [Coemansia mojavensis]|nr:hypothetical protein BX667DRAFT_500555 [Coemansia mojavensis]